MMTSQACFNDSSGMRKHSPTSAQPRIPQALELKEMNTPVTSCTVSRDSGCYTGSPMTAVHSPTHSSKFVFEDGFTTPNRSVRSKTNMVVHSTPLVDSGTHYVADPFEMDSDDDDVFHSAEDTEFIDSGVQISDLGASGAHSGIAHLRSREEITSDTESEDESSTESEGSGGVLFELADSRVSSPIDIPTRSRNSSPSGAEGDDDEYYGPTPSAPHPSTASAPHITRRATVIGDMRGSGDRPLSEHGRGHPLTRGQFYSQSVEGAEGPLPDVVPTSLTRARAFSESAIYNNWNVRRVGTSLRDMCDEFSNTRLQKQRNQLNLIQQRQRSPNHVLERQRRRVSGSASPNNSPGFLATLHQKLFSSSQE